MKRKWESSHRANTKAVRLKEVTVQKEVYEQG